MNKDRERHFNPERERVIKHSIAGRMQTDWVKRWTIFTGSFEEFPPTVINGNLLDEHGEAIISGTLSEGSLIFDKIYTTGPSVGAQIHYEYSLVGNGIWKGGFHYEQYGDVLDGESECVTQVVGVEYKEETHE